MHRTKCTNVIKNVLCNHFEADFLKNIGKNKFSLIIDKANDISLLKLLSLSIIYFSNGEKKVVSTIFVLIEIEMRNA